MFWSRTVLREIKKKEIFNIIVDTSLENIADFFRAILQLQMNNHLVRKSLIIKIKTAICALYILYTVLKDKIENL